MPKKTNTDLIKIRPTELMWSDCELDKDSEKTAQLKMIVNKIVANKSKYVFVSKKVGVPVWVIAGIHYRESSLNFTRNMVNGQRLDQVTTIVPKGLGPWKDWESACIDAFNRRKYDSNWTIPEWLDFCERYNGLGYRKKGIPSPYVWAFTNQSSEKGRYVSDGKFDYNSEEKRPGVAAILEYAIMVGEKDIFS